MTEDALRIRAELDAIRVQLCYGVITYDEAEELAKPWLEKLNAKGKEVAKRYGKKFHAFTFTEIMR